MREERERTRQEAATKRKGRAERRRVEGQFAQIMVQVRVLISMFSDSEPSEELPLVSRNSVAKSAEPTAPPLDPPPSSQLAAPDTPPSNPAPISHKKGGRPPNARKGKLGKNQYTKDRDVLENDDRSPNRSQSRDVPREDNGHTSTTNKSANHESKVGKSKGSNSKITMTDMKKRATAILAFISQTEYELGESISPTAGDTAERMIRDLADGLPMIKVNGENGNSSKDGEMGEATPAKEFKDLSCKEMIVELTKQLLKWQDEFA